MSCSEPFALCHSERSEESQFGETLHFVQGDNREPAVLSPSLYVILSAAKNLLPLRASSAKHLYWLRINSAKNLPMLRACPERSEGINSAKSLPETGISENRKAPPC